jgi:hypothetical protein
MMAGDGEIREGAMSRQRSRGHAWRFGFLVLAVSLAFSPTPASSAAARADFPPPVVESLTDGLVIAEGEPITIDWTGGDPEGSVSIELVDVDIYQVVSSVTPNTPNHGSIDWTFPADLPCGHTYEFYIQDTQPKWTYGQPFTVECLAPSK